MMVNINWSVSVWIQPVIFLGAVFHIISVLHDGKADDVDIKIQQAANLKIKCH